MRTRPRTATLGWAALVALLVGATLPGQHGPVAHASAPPPLSSAAPARLGVLHGEVDGTRAHVAIADVSTGSHGAPLRSLGSVAHVRGSAVRGRLAPGRAHGDELAFVVAEEEGPRGSTYVSALHRVEAGRETRLCGGVALASTPIVTSAGRVLVARGSDGPEPTNVDAQKLVLRVDELSIDDVDPASGSTRTLFRGKGYQAFLAARLEVAGREEVVVYLSAPGGARLFALDPISATTRTLGTVAPFARDFSWDATHRSLVFANLAPDAATYEILSLDVVGGGTRTLHAGHSEHFMPFALPSGAVAVSMEGDKGLALLSPPGSTPRLRLLSPLGDGSDAVLAASAGGRWVAVRHTPAVPSAAEPPAVVAFDIAGTEVVTLSAPPHQFTEVLGFAEGGTP